MASARSVLRDACGAMGAFSVTAVRGVRPDAEPFTAEDPFDFAQGRLFAKLRTGSEDAGDISWTTLGGRDYRNGLGYM
jgi:hypothetical protein